MLGPNVSSQPGKPKRENEEDWGWRSGDRAGDDRECELCGAQTNTNVEHGLCVCPTCSETFLP